MPPNRRRPTAFEVSFPDEPLDELEVDSDAHAGRARGREASPNNRNQRRRTVEKAPPRDRHYEPHGIEFEETAGMLLEFEEPGQGEDSLPVRVLSRFVFFDPDKSDLLVGLGDLEKPDVTICGAGIVLPCFENEEDEALDEDLDEGERPMEKELRLDKIEAWWMDFMKRDAPLYIRTQYSWYELSSPSNRYRRYYRDFYKPLRIQQLVISAAHEDPTLSYRDFLERCKPLDIMGLPIFQNDITENVNRLRTTLETLEDADRLRDSQLIRYLLNQAGPLPLQPDFIAPRKRPVELRVPQPLLGNLDIAVLRSESQNSTHVTPTIAKLAGRYFQEPLVSVGPRPKKPEPKVDEEELLLRLRAFLGRALNAHRRIRVDGRNRVRPHSQFLKCVTVDGVEYSVGDTVVLARGSTDGRRPPELPQPDQVACEDLLSDYFWFARIIRIQEDEMMHIHWFEHSSKTAMHEINDPQELFLTDMCSTVKLSLLVGKVDAHFVPPGEKFPRKSYHDYFYRFKYDANSGSYQDIDVKFEQEARVEGPPDNCPVCKIIEKDDVSRHAQQIARGVSWQGADYHIDDFAMIKANSGPCHIGHIVEVRFPTRARDGNVEAYVVVKLYGRVDRLGMETELQDERHLFATDTRTTVPVHRLGGVCHVIVPPFHDFDVPKWLAESPQHFYAKFYFESLNAVWWRRRALREDEVTVCRDCVAKDRDESRDLDRFLVEGKPLRALDPFAGVGAFGMAMEETGVIKVTHAIEISPSAAKTLKRNATADVKVYNQCANLILKQSIKKHAGLPVDELKSITGAELPAPPLPDEIDCIVAGFPCQPHSRMNMYQRTTDSKTYLILNLLSWIDHIKPKYIMFENVRGFLSFRLRARQQSRYTITGGIEMGGLKFLLRALTELDYQCRFALLQAAHYGTPQGRVRFFLAGARRGLPLPNLPQPSHDFPVEDALVLHLPGGRDVHPILAVQGTAPHRFVTVEDAIGDLKRFDWRKPNTARPQAGGNADQLPSRICDSERSFCGYQGPSADVGYESAPRNTFQAWARRQPSADIQQYTRTYEPVKVGRVMSVPMRAGADYRDIPPELWEWQFANPSSAVARGGFRAGMYGRIDKDKWFQTTVTNVDPTAKQCKVLNPWCKRMVTVRELARSQGFPDHFVFYAHADHVVTMHRQIGNAVPWQVSIALARELRLVVVKKWHEDRQEVEEDGSDQHQHRESRSRTIGSEDVMEVD